MFNLRPMQHISYAILVKVVPVLKQYTKKAYGIVM